MQVVVTGATGYVGGRLVPLLLEAGHQVVCLVRSQRKLASRPWSGDTRVRTIEIDLTNEDAVATAMKGCQAAYYLIHSMEVTGRHYAQRDRHLAQTFARAAERAGVGRIIYLGGLGELGGNLSEHLASRREVEACLSSTPVPVTVLRAAMIIGSGSASFEILRYLVERLPAMITPRWVNTESQPIAIRNVLQYLLACLTTPATAGQTLDIGGPEVVTYRRLMEITADELGLGRRWVIPVPLLTPRLSSLWIHLVTPVSARIARPLAEGLRNRVVCRDDRAAQLMPQPLLGVREAIAAALVKVNANDISTAWTDAGVIPGDPDWAGGTVFTDERSVDIEAPADAVFAAVCKVGGGHGYYAADWLWRLRGMIDRLIGGPGLRRGRRHPEHLAFGDALDFWRVTGVDSPRRLTLRAEMKLPGEAMLEFQLTPGRHGGTCLTQTARFRPRGLAGLAYWYAVLPFHGFVFRGMLGGIARDAARVSSKIAATRPTAVLFLVCGFAVGSLLLSCASKMESPRAATQPIPAETQAPMKAPFAINEANLPRGFPAPGPVGAVIVKNYPAYRAAVVRQDRAQNERAQQSSMFGVLFKHIKKNGITMTAPVEMTYESSTELIENTTPATKPASATPSSSRPVAMAFLYGQPEWGKPGADGAVDVVDVPAMTVVSVGVRGNYNTKNFDSALSKLTAYLSDKAGLYQAVGPPRYLGYNSPFVPWFLRIGEVQIPVKESQASRQQR
ncbi:MAG: heme-binding protein [Planctomycetes bacterium]|nr:heme-binding protein [Planctomycetota bacterium]